MKKTIIILYISIFSINIDSPAGASVTLVPTNEDTNKKLAQAEHSTTTGTEWSQFDFEDLIKHSTPSGLFLRGISLTSGFTRSY